MNCLTLLSRSLWRYVAPKPARSNKRPVVSLIGFSMEHSIHVEFTRAAAYPKWRRQRTHGQAIVIHPPAINCWRLVIVPTCCGKIQLRAGRKTENIRQERVIWDRDH